ncbi:D-alanyl-D-alanine carboxypeptidase family protein [Patescibacteria group bacterium]
MNFKKLHSWKKEFFKFFKFLKSKKQLRIKFILLILLFLIQPTQNFYSKLVLKSGRPVYRKIDIDLPEVSLYPVNITGKAPPYFSAQSAVIVDVPSMTVIFSKNPDTSLLPASTTKIMTALVALDHWQVNNVLEVKNVLQVGQTMKLVEGEKITVENLLYGLLVQSGNDAAYTLADNYPGGFDNFIKKMNEKSQELNLNSTFYLNPAGIEANGHLTTAHDLAILASYALKNEMIAKIVAIPSITVTDVSFQIQHELNNINQLVGKVPGVKGVKTGWTENAGECLVSYIERDEKQVLIVVLNSQDRFVDTTALINWVFNNFSWEAT